MTFLPEINKLVWFQQDLPLGQEYRAFACTHVVNASTPPHTHTHVFRRECTLQYTCQTPSFYLGFPPTLLRQPSWKTGCKMSQLLLLFSTLNSFRDFAAWLDAESHNRQEQTVRAACLPGLLADTNTHFFLMTHTWWKHCAMGGLPFSRRLTSSVTADTRVVVRATRDSARFGREACTTPFNVWRENMNMFYLSQASYTSLAAYILSRTAMLLTRFCRVLSTEEKDWTKIQWAF